MIMNSLTSLFHSHHVTFKYCFLRYTAEMWIKRQQKREVTSKEQTLIKHPAIVLRRWIHYVMNPRNRHQIYRISHAHIHNACKLRKPNAHSRNAKPQRNSFRTNKTTRALPIASPSLKGRQCTCDVRGDARVYGRWISLTIRLWEGKEIKERINVSDLRTRSSDRLFIFALQQDFPNLTDSLKGQGLKYTIKNHLITSMDRYIFRFNVGGNKLKIYLLLDLIFRIFIRFPVFWTIANISSY